MLAVTMMREAPSDSFSPAFAAYSLHHSEFPATILSMSRHPHFRDYLLLVLVMATAMSRAQTAGTVTIKIEPSQAYIERRSGEQRINFDLLLHNAGTLPLEINKIQISVYDSNGALAFRRYLDENGVPSGISTIPDRMVPGGGSLDIFNPFFSFSEEMPLARLHYEVFFERTDEKQPNLLNFVTQAEADVYPTPYVGKTRLILPLKGRVYVFDGHDFYAHHRRQDVFRTGQFRTNSVRYAYDLMITNATGELYHGNRFVKENWFCYGTPVYAPAEGRVVDAANDLPENSYKDGELVYPYLPDGIDPIGLGNHVVIDHGNGEFSILVHMKPGSVRVKKGDRVKRGEQVGAIGFSGDTFLPHLHYMLMDGTDERTSRGLPSYFDDFGRILGSKIVEVKHGQIDSGDFVESSHIY
jgi:murein DD-endopeptidase MepM/ murein hydrolase activator NlpD